MTNAKTTKRALLSSIVSLILCFTMLLSTTYAWFTDTVKSGNNIITAGNLDVELYHTNNYVTTKEKVGGLTDLFTVAEGETFLWEPGAVLWENFEVANKGSLALKYQLALNFKNATETALGSGKTLADVLKVAVINGGFNGTREDAKTLSYNYSLRSFALEGKLEADDASTPDKEEDSYDVYGIVIYWEPTANDNEYNVKGGLTIDLGVNLFATQLTAESDSFDSNYDVDAWEDTKADRPTFESAVANINNDGSASVEVNDAPSASTAKTTIDAPAGTFEATDKVEVEVATVNSLFDVNADGGVVASLDITMKVNGESADLTDGTYYTVTTYISKGLENVTVAYTGTDGKAQPTFVSYDSVTGKLVFTTNHFSNYAVSGKALAYDAKNDTALTTPAAVIDAAKEEGSVVIIPDANKGVIKDYIDEMDDPTLKKEAENAINNTKVGKVVSTADELQAAIDADETSIIFGTDIKGNVTVTQVPNVKITIEGNGYDFEGIIIVNGGSARHESAAVTIQNVNFIGQDSSVDAYIKLGVSGDTNTRYTNNVTVQDCTFSGDGVVAVKSYTGGDLNLTLKNLIVNKGMHSLAQVKNVEKGLIVTGCKVYSKNGLNVNNSTNLTMDNCAFDVQGYAVRFGADANTTDESFTISNSTLKSACAEEGDAIIEIRAGATNATLTLTDTKMIGDVAFKGATDDTKITIDGVAAIAGPATLAKALTADVEEIYVVLAGDVDLPISSLGQQTGGSGEYKLGGESTKSITIDLNGSKLNIATNYWSAIGAKNADAVFTIKNGTMTSSQASGTWNSYDVTFANCNYVIENVVFEKAVAFTNAGKNVTLTNVTINETHDYYALWISAEGQNVEINGLTVNSTAGRGIKIDEQYVGTPAKVTLKVSNAVFNTAKKAAIVVKSVAGADITLSNVNIANTIDTIHAVWVDEDADAYASLVTVTGGEVISEANVAANLADLKNVLAKDNDVVLLNDITVAKSEAGSNGYGVVGINILKGQAFDGNGKNFGVNAWGTWDSAINTTGGVIKNVTVNSGMRGIFISHNSTESGKVYLENVTIDGTIYTISCDQGTNSGLEAKNSTFNGWTSYAATLGDAKFVDCSFGEGQGYAFCRPYAPTTFVGCDFEAGYEIDACAAVAFENCTIGDVALTAENLATLVTGGIANASVK